MTRSANEAMETHALTDLSETGLNFNINPDLISYRVRAAPCVILYVKYENCEYFSHKMRDFHMYGTVFCLVSR